MSTPADAEIGRSMESALQLAVPGGRSSARSIKLLSPPVSDGRDYRLLAAPFKARRKCGTPMDIGAGTAPERLVDIGLALRGDIRRGLGSKHHQCLPCRRAPLLRSRRIERQERDRAERRDQQRCELPSGICHDAISSEELPDCAT